MNQIGIRATAWEILPNLPHHDPDYVYVRASMRDRHGQKVAMSVVVDKYTLEEIVNGNDVLGKVVLEEMWRSFKRGLERRFTNRMGFWSYNIGHRWHNHGFSL